MQKRLKIFIPSDWKTNLTKGFWEPIKSRIVQQSLGLYLSHLLVFLCSSLTSVLITRVLGPTNYGTLSFILAIITFLNPILEFGVADTAAKFFANKEEQEQNAKYIGGFLFMSAGTLFVFALVIFISSSFIDLIFDTHISSILRSIAPVAGISVAYLLLQRICQGLNRIRLLSVLNAAPKVLYFVGIYVLVTMSILTVSRAVFLYFLTITLTSVLGFFILKPALQNLRDVIHTISKDFKQYGLHIYLSNVTYNFSYRADNFLISYFRGTTSVGFYSLAGTLTAPILLLPNSIHTSLFRLFAKQNRISTKLLCFDLIWLAGCSSVIILLGQWLINLLFTESYLSSVPLLLPLGIALTCQGMYQLFVFFLASHGKGRSIKRAALGGAFVNIGVNVTMIPAWGASGAAWASAISSATILILQGRDYVRFRMGADIESTFWSQKKSPKTRNPEIIS